MTSQLGDGGLTEILPGAAAALTLDDLVSLLSSRIAIPPNALVSGDGTPRVQFAQPPFEVQVRFGHAPTLFERVQLKRDGALAYRIKVKKRAANGLPQTMVIEALQEEVVMHLRLVQQQDLPANSSAFAM